MLTKRPDIVYALPPKHTRRKKTRVEHPNLPTVIYALSPKGIERKKKAAALQANVPRIVIARNPSPLIEVDRDKAAEATDRLRQEIVRRANEAAPALSLPRVGGNSRISSGTEHSDPDCERVTGSVDKVVDRWGISGLTSAKL